MINYYNYFKDQDSRLSRASVNTGWIAVEREVKILHNLETTPLQIKTNTTAGKVSVYFYNAAGKRTGDVSFDLKSPPTYSKYSIGLCRKWTKFPSVLPSETHKVWQLTKQPGPRIKLQCNGEIVLDILLSDQTCDNNENWKEDWGDVKQIMFRKWDTASDYYIPTESGDNFFVTLPYKINTGVFAC